MRVLFLSTYAHSGGAAIAAGRLLRAVQAEGVDVSMLTMTRRLPFLAERAVVWAAYGFRRKHLWDSDIALFGQDITSTPEYQAADVVHLHWVNQGFLSLRTIDKIVHSGRRVVWTMHDIWPLAGHWHYGGEAEPLPWLTRHLVNKKRNIYQRAGITFVTPSRWLAETACDGPLAIDNSPSQQDCHSLTRPFPQQSLHTIPNCLDTSLFVPRDKREARAVFGLPADRPLVLFGCQNAADERKGFRYLIEACKSLPAGAADLVLFGARTDEVRALLPQGLCCHDVGTIKGEERMAALYAAADTFVTPSLCDNLPNTVMEAMACGTPCVAFRIGGLPEMIAHRHNGYIAEPRNADDLAAGILYALHTPDLAQAARDKVLSDYDPHRVAQQYIDLYQQ